ncbi:MAG: CoA transferase [Pseudomonadota bacterium]|nr:CoA transferase [Pseudomonadota bacterium]
MDSEKTYDPPLKGVRILELGQIIAGTYGGQLLSDLGAEVIKIESPTGDLGRLPSIAPYKGNSGLFLTFNRNKKSLVIDLKKESGLNIFYDLVKISDVVIDNFRSGVLEKLKVDYPKLKEVNNKIIQCSVTGFGLDGEYKDLPALDIIIQSISGMLAITGEPNRPPSRVGIPISDLSGGVFSGNGILAALYSRERTGQGRRIELSMFDAMLSLLSYMGTMWLTNGELPTPQGTKHEYTVPWQAFKTSDSYVVIAARQDIFWEKLCEVLGSKELLSDHRFKTNQLRVENKDVLVPILENIFVTKKTDDWLKVLRKSGVPVAPVNNLDGVFSEPPVNQREMIVTYDHPEVGKVRLPGNPIKFKGVKLEKSTHAPILGEHTDQLLNSLLNMSQPEIDDLRNKGVVF